MKNLAYYIGILVCTGVFLSSCIKEDLSDCVATAGGIVPQFVLVPYDESDSNKVVNDNLYSAKVYVFDEQDRFVATYAIDGRPKLRTTYTPNWGLPAGKYTYTVWLNHHEKFQVDPCSTGKSIRAQTLLQLMLPSSRMVDNTDNIPFLCFGHVVNEELTAAGNLITIPVKQLTNRINLRVTGLNNIASLRASAEDADEYAFSISDNNAAYGFDGEFASNEYFTYSTSKRADADVLNASLTVLKLSGNRQNPALTIKNKATGEEVFPENLTNNLIRLILAGDPQNDFDKKHVYDIGINIPVDKEIPVTITINDWILDQSNPELNIN